MNNPSWISSDQGEKRQVVLGITGSVAAYKAAELARLMFTWGYHIRTVMTDSAQKFISSTTMSAITGNPVTTEFWGEEEISSIGHIQLADWAQALVIAPATADFIAKLAAGMADTPLLAIALATKAPILVAPAMNVNMLEHPKTRENIEELKRRGVLIVEPDEGDLACGWSGSGRLAAPEELFYHVRRALSQGDYAGKRILISTGPTREALDPVRFISNRSSGKMGVALAREAFRRGAQVTLVHGPVRARVPREVRCLEVISAIEMRDAMMERAFAASQGEKPDVVIMAAAVADYRPKQSAPEKVKKGSASISIDLAKNPDILNELGQKKGDGDRPVLVGFAVETGEIENLLDEGRRKLHEKHADMIVGNFAEEAFDLDTNRVWLIDKHGRQEEIATQYKSRVANKILDVILKL